MQGVKCPAAPHPPGEGIALQGRPGDGGRRTTHLDDRVATDLLDDEHQRIEAATTSGFAAGVDPRFHYVGSAATGQNEQRAGVIRRHLPGRRARIRLIEHLLADAADLFARDIGRARGDLQYRLSETARRLIAAVDAATGSMPTGWRPR